MRSDSRHPVKLFTFLKTSSILILDRFLLLFELGPNGRSGRHLARFTAESTCDILQYEKYVYFGFPFEFEGRRGTIRRPCAPSRMLYRSHSHPRNFVLSSSTVRYVLCLHCWHNPLIIKVYKRGPFHFHLASPFLKRDPLHLLSGHTPRSPRQNA